MNEYKKECRNCKHYGIKTPDDIPELKIWWCNHDEHPGATSAFMYHCDDFGPSEKVKDKLNPDPPKESKYALTYEPMQLSRDRVIDAIEMRLQGYQDLYDSDGKEALRYALFYLNNDGAIRERLNIHPKFIVEENNIKMVL